MLRSHAGLTALMVVLALSSSFVPAFAPTWGSPASVIVDWNDNLFPNILQTSTGDIWLAFQKSSAASEDDIYLMVNNGFGWSGQILLVGGPDHDVTPSLVELVNGTIMMVWPGKKAGDYDLYTMSYTAGSWSSSRLLVSGIGDDFNPSMVRAADGRVWLAWSRSTLANGGGDLYYKVFNGLSWGPEQALLTSAYEEKFPSITQTKDGKIWLVYESNSVGTRLYYTIFNGTAWMNSRPLTTTTNADKWPSIAQDRDGTIWAFWGRELSTSDPLRPFQWDLFYKSSTDNGVSWSLDTTVAPEGATDDWHPSIMQARDKTLWVAWNSDRPSLYGTHNIYLIKSSIILTHDVAVSLQMPQDRPRSGETFSPRAVVKNLGDYNETVTLTVTVDGSTIGSATATLLPGRNTTYTYPWATAGQPLGPHSLQATISQVTGERNTWDNSATAKFQIVPGGDVERNGVVNIADLALVGASFGALPATAQFNPHADLTGDGRIDISDMVVVGSEFGRQIVLSPNFYLSSSRYYVSLGPGTSADITLSAGSISGLASPLYLTVAGQGAGITTTLTPRLIPLPGTSTLRFEANSNPVVGAYPLTVSATNGTLTRTLQLNLLVNPPPDFGLAAAPQSATVIRGSSATTTLTVSSLYDFSSPVTLTASGLPTGVTASYSLNPATPPLNGAVSSTLTFTANATAALGTFTITATGTSGSLVHSATVFLTVLPPPDFTLSATPSTLTIVQGTTSSTTVTLTSAGGFSSSTLLTVSGLPSGVTGSFSPNPVTPPPDGTASSTLTLTATSTATVGTVTFTVTGTSGSLVRTTTISLTVKVPPDFSLQPTPTSLAIDRGSSASVTITITSTGDFNQPVSLTVSGLPSGVTATFSVNPATPPPNGAVTTLLTISASSTATTGTFTLTIIGTSGSLLRSTTVSLTVNLDPDFSIASLQSSLTITQDGSDIVTVTVTSIGAFSSPVTLSASGLPTGVSSFYTPNPVTPPAGGSATSSLTLSAGATAATGTFTITLTGVSGSLSHSTTITLTVNPKPDFTISASPTSLTIYRSGSAGTTTITLSSIAGFSGAVTLTATGLPSGVTASFAPNPVTPPGTSTLSLTASSTATTGSFTITVTGTSGSLSHSVSISLTVKPPPDFTLSSSLTSVSVPRGSSRTVTITVASLNDFNSPVTLSISGVPSRVSASFSPNPVTPPANGSVTSTLTITAQNNAAVATYTLTITGTSGGLTHSITITLQIT